MKEGRKLEEYMASTDTISVTDTAFFYKVTVCKIVDLSCSNFEDE